MDDETTKDHVDGGGEECGCHEEAKCLDHKEADYVRGVGGEEAAHVADQLNYARFYVSRVSPYIWFY